MNIRQFDEDFARSRRNFRIMSRFVFGFIGFVFVLVIGGFIASGYVVYQVAKDPSVIGNVAGEVVKGFNETVK